ncbi:hypothetical protein KC878_02825 [Candidatus Saccharibacteria bacterium]|nr:hypothetical protein [Candidatus Saccharibacteria bacterium]MCB9820954.1 hypothetical protein [Candidatus Nomurabacteria bacterium]
MKYISIFFVVLVIWIAAILMALSRQETDQIFRLFVATVFCTCILFLIGFAKK